MRIEFACLFCKYSKNNEKYQTTKCMSILKLGNEELNPIKISQT